MNKKSLVCTLGLFVVGSLGLQADIYDNETPLYVAARGAYTISNKSSVRNVPNSSLKLDDGYDASLALGIKVPLRSADGGRTVPMALRFEVEGGYGDNRVKSASVGGTAVPGAGGHLENTRIMTNVLLDIPLFDSFYLSLGGGVGWARVHGDLNGVGLSGSGTSDEVAYQGIVAVGTQLGESIQVELGYRALSYSNPTLGGAQLDAPLISMFGASIQFNF